MDYRIKETVGFSPNIGELVSMLEYTRLVTLEELEELTVQGLDYLADGSSNTIGALLLHMASVEFVNQIISFENRDLTEEEFSQWKVPLELGGMARKVIRDQPLEYYLEELAAVRRKTLTLMKDAEDEWLYRERKWDNGVAHNNYYLWFHMLEDEISHRGQIRIIKRMLEISKI
ncbi:DinB family protein [Planococcus sp. ISL-109]|uniref:DinB family protein n=1 Tax=Planococcus sp. ISL-109 TaxID=2819166 RepID=UPI001BE7CC90|nr:DinB family protein [Planococcus sp. ISL-109]MBT2583464.1 DUF664 domain-containing protein [Planococcus sp. ISL-109]